MESQVDAVFFLLRNGEMGALAPQIFNFPIEYCYRTNALFFNKFSLIEFVGSQTATLQTTALLHVLFIALHYVIYYSLA